MRHLLTTILTLLTATTFSQSITHINTLIKEINQTQFTDSIIVLDSPKVATLPIHITAYLNGDTLLKTIAKYANSTRIKFSYYDKQDANPVYVKDIDSVTNQVLVEVYGKRYEVYQSSIVIPLEPQEVKQPYHVLQNSDFSTEVGFALVDRQAEKYTFTVKLIVPGPTTPHCGTIAWAIVQKFEVLSTTYENYNNKYVLIVQTCPEFLGDNFFQKDTVYKIDVATNSGVTFGYSVFNNFETENLPTFWTREISKLK